MISKAFDLSGKVAIVTGSGRGLGRAMACALSEAGANVVIADIIAPDREETCRMIESRGQA
jgi:NAD(P)-dependent dehydrogenase (short-subunit alcohol dehydrogenase family)